MMTCGRLAQNLPVVAPRDSQMLKAKRYTIFADRTPSGTHSKDSIHISISSRCPQPAVEAFDVLTSASGVLLNQSAAASPYHPTYHFMQSGQM